MNESPPPARRRQLPHRLARRTDRPVGLEWKLGTRGTRPPLRDRKLRTSGGISNNIADVHVTADGAAGRLALSLAIEQVPLRGLRSGRRATVISWSSILVVVARADTSSATRSRNARHLDTEVSETRGCQAFHRRRRCPNNAGPVECLKATDRSLVVARVPRLLVPTAATAPASAIERYRPRA